MSAKSRLCFWRVPSLTKIDCVRPLFPSSKFKSRAQAYPYPLSATKLDLHAPKYHLPLRRLCVNNKAGGLTLTDWQEVVIVSSSFNGSSFGLWKKQRQTFIKPRSNKELFFSKCVCVWGCYRKPEQQKIVHSLFTTITYRSASAGR